MGNYAGNRSRPLAKLVTFNHGEMNFLNLRIAKSGNPPFTTFARNSLLTSKMVHIEFTDTKEMLGQLSRIGNNLNQIAHRANETEKVTGKIWPKSKTKSTTYFQSSTITCCIVLILSNATSGWS